MNNSTRIPLPNGLLPDELVEKDNKKITKAQRHQEFNKIRNIEITYGNVNTEQHPYILVSTSHGTINFITKSHIFGSKI